MEANMLSPSRTALALAFALLPLAPAAAPRAVAEMVDIPAGQTYTPDYECTDYFRVAGSLVGEHQRILGGVEVLPGGRVYLEGGSVITTSGESLLHPGGGIEATAVDVGGPGGARFVQSGGDVVLWWESAGGRLGGWLYVDAWPEGEGTYEIHGGTIDTGAIEVGGLYGIGRFYQYGGDVRTSWIMISAPQGSAARSRYEFLGGLLHADGISVGTRGAGLFHQAAGTRVDARRVDIGEYQDPDRSADGEYLLDAGAALSAARLTIGDTGTGRLVQYGDATVGWLDVGPGGRYEVAGGMLAVEHGWRVRGVIDLADRAADLHPTDAIVDLSEGTYVGANRTSMHVAGDSLVILAPGRAAPFGSFANDALTHVRGTTLVLEAGQTVRGAGQIHDAVVCRGQLLAHEGAAIDLLDGLVLDGGTVELGEGRLHVHGDGSRFGAGSLSGGCVELAPQATLSIGGGRIEPDEVRCWGARVIQTGGDVRTRYVGVGAHTEAPGPATWTISDGATLEVDHMLVQAFNGEEAGIVQRGGDVRFGYLRLWNDVGTPYELAGGTLSGTYLTMADGAALSSFTQRGGAADIAYVTIAGPSRYDLLGGSLGARTLTAANAAQVRIGGGALDVDQLTISDQGGSWPPDAPALLEITSPAAEVTIREWLSLGRMAELRVAAGAGLVLDSASLRIHGTDAEALAGLGALAVHAAGDGTSVLEVAGRDLGDTPAGFEGNFHLGTLVVGRPGVAEWPCLQLADLWDNQPDAAGHDALYVDTLVVRACTTLDLNGLNLYYRHADIDPAARVLTGGGMLVPVVPEPATAALLAAGLATLSRPGRRRRATGHAA